MATKVKLYSPFPHQAVVNEAISKHLSGVERFTDDFQKTFVVKAMRQVGKSAMTTNELVRFALKYNKSVNAYISPTLKLAKKTFGEVVAMFEGSNYIKSSNKTDLIISFVNGSSIWFFSAEQGEALRGFNVSGLLVIDEAAFIQDVVYRDCISPWCDFYKAVTLMISTPQFKSGFFYDHYVLGFSISSSCKSFDWSEYDMTIIRSEKRLEEKRLITPDKKFRCEYLGEWLDGEGSVFNNFNDCLYPEFFTGDKLFIGIDWGSGSGQDSTVVSAFNELGEQALLWKDNISTPMECVSKITEILQANKDNIKRVQAENNSLGAVYIDALRKANKGIKIDIFNTTNDSKRDLVEQFQVALEQNKVKLKEDREQTNQLSFYESGVSPTGKITYNAKKGFHDDIVMADMLAWDAYINNKKGSSFRVSFI